MATFRFIMASYETNPMAVSHEIKSQLAKLLATEDLVVEHKKTETACFNVHTRVLTLPMWEKASSTVYDLLVGHEVGHALYTPDEDWSKTHKIPQQFVNVVEDARIEKLMKRRYAGLAKTFYNGYKQLNDEDFFSIEDEDISTFNLADRANLLFKIGNFIDVPLENDEEKEIIGMISEIETFADTLIASEILYKYCKKKQDEQKKVSDIESHNQSGKSQTPSSDAVEKSEDKTEEGGDDQSMESEETGESGSASASSDSEVDSDEPEVQTADSLKEKIEELVDMEAVDNIYVELPKVNLETIIASNESVHKEINESFEFQQKRHDIDLFEYPDTEFKKFKLSAQKEVNYLVKEFECRKAADSYARATTSRTGILDCSKLHTYKYNEDLFKKVTTLADGKNHGLVFVLDWSGSMANVLPDTCKQLFNLIWFCKKVAIPFEVYAFTNEWRRGGYDYETGVHLPGDRSPHYEKKEGLVAVNEGFSLMNILTSKVSGKEFECQMKNIWRLALCFSSMHTCHYTYSNRLCLSGTPLNESLITLHQILPKFQKENKLQKVQCIILTDGEANQLPRHVEIKRSLDAEPYMGLRSIYPDSSFLRDRKLGRTYRFDYGYEKFTDTLLNNLKDNFPSVNFIGIRVLGGRDANRFISLYHKYGDKEYDKITKDWRKLRSFTIKNSGYDAYFALSSASLAQESEFEVDEGATKAKIKSAFVKSLKTKKLNKKVLGEFISLVA